MKFDKAGVGNWRGEKEKEGITSGCLLKNKGVKGRKYNNDQCREKEEKNHKKRGKKKKLKESPGALKTQILYKGC